MYRSRLSASSHIVINKHMCSTILLTCPILQVDMAIASLLEPEMAIKRLLLLLELAREGLQDGQAVPMGQWQQVLREFAM